MVLPFLSANLATLLIRKEKSLKTFISENAGNKKLVDWLIVGFYVQLSYEWPAVKGFLRDPNPYSREIRRKSQKTPNGKVDERDWETNPALPVYQFWAKNHSTTGGALVARENV